MAPIERYDWIERAKSISVMVRCNNDWPPAVKTWPRARGAAEFDEKKIAMEDYNVTMSAADRDRQEQAFYDKYGDDSLKSTALKVAAAVALYATVMAGISAALH
jgi:hypothetical protein